MPLMPFQCHARSRTEHLQLRLQPDWLVSRHVLPEPCLSDISILSRACAGSVSTLVIAQPIGTFPAKSHAGSACFHNVLLSHDHGELQPTPHTTALVTSQRAITEQLRSTGIPCSS